VLKVENDMYSTTILLINWEGVS